MAFPDPLFARLSRFLPDAPAWIWRVGAGLLLLGASGAIAGHHPAIGGALLLAALLAEGLARARAGAAPDAAQGAALVLGLMLPPFGFALADPARALAAMFLTLALAVLSVLRRDDVSAVTWLVAGALLLACILPDYFSLLAYLVGIACFVAAGQGVARRRA